MVLYNSKTFRLTDIGRLFSTHHLERCIWDKVPRMDQVKFVKDCLSRPHPFKFFEGCLPQILIGLLLNTLFPYQLTNYIWWATELKNKLFYIIPTAGYLQKTAHSIFSDIFTSRSVQFLTEVAKTGNLSNSKEEHLPCGKQQKVDILIQKLISLNIKWF